MMAKAGLDLISMTMIENNAKNLPNCSFHLFTTSPKKFKNLQTG